MNLTPKIIGVGLYLCRGTTGIVPLLLVARPHPPGNQFPG